MTTRLWDLADELEDGQQGMPAILGLTNLADYWVEDARAKAFVDSFPSTERLRHDSPLFALGSGWTIPVWEVAEACRALATVGNWPADIRDRDPGPSAAELLPSSSELHLLRRVGQILQCLERNRQLGQTPADLAVLFDDSDGPVVLRAMTEFEAAFKRWDGVLFECRPGRRGYFRRDPQAAACAWNAWFETLKQNVGSIEGSFVTLWVCTDDECKRIGLDASRIPASSRGLMIDISTVSINNVGWHPVVVVAPYAGTEAFKQRIGTKFGIWPPDKLWMWEPLTTWPDYEGVWPLLFVASAGSPDRIVANLKDWLPGLVPSPDYLLTRPGGPSVQRVAQQRNSPGRIAKPAVTYCLECGQPLTDPLSISRGYGDLCYEKMTATAARNGGSRSSSGKDGGPRTWTNGVLMRLGDALHRLSSRTR